MKATLRYNRSSGFWIEVEAENIKQAIKMMSEYLEVFGVHECGKCQSTALVCQHFEDKDGHDYYKLRCTACGALLDFGQHKSGGTLFVKRKDKEGMWLPDGGWYHYSKRQQQSEEAQIAPDDQGYF